MIQNVIKRDGRVCAFDKDKIVAAIYKAAHSVGGTDKVLADSLAEKVEELLAEKYPEEYPTVEQIQDAVEKVLIECGYAKTAKAYILYRAQRNRVRQLDSTLMKELDSLTVQKAYDSDTKRENANINTDTAMGTMLKYGSEASKAYSHLSVLTPEQSTAHSEGDIHIHDLDFYNLTETCVQIGIGDLLRRGFSTEHGYVRTPAGIGSAAALACIAIQANQNDQHGGQSIWDFDYGLGSYVAKSYISELINHLEDMFEDFDDDTGKAKLAAFKEELMTYWENHDEHIMNEAGYTFVRMHIRRILPDITDKQLDRLMGKVDKAVDRLTFQAMEALIHNLNTMQSRAGSQVPFSSVNMGTDTSTEGRLVIKNLLLATEKGLGNGETAIFPVSIFKVKEGVNYNKNDPNYDLFHLACKVSAQRLFPNFSFIDAPFNITAYQEGRPETEVAVMGCRTRVLGNVYDPTKQIVAGRGNLSFTSINLPRLAIEANKDIDKFYKGLDKIMNLVIEQLLDRMAIQSAKHVYNYPMLMGQGIWIDSLKLKETDTVAEVLKHGTLGVGFIGLAECLKALTGKHHGESEESQKLGLEIIGHMRQRLDEESEKRKLNFSLIGTPKICGHLCRNV